MTRVKKVVNYSITLGTPLLERGAISLAKNIGVQTIRAGAGMIPIIGNLVTAGVEAYQQKQIHDLQETSEGLVKSQGILQGQIEEVQAGINEVFTLKQIDILNLIII